LFQSGFISVWLKFICFMRFALTFPFFFHFHVSVCVVLFRWYSHFHLFFWELFLVYESASTRVHLQFVVGSVLFIFLVFCVVFCLLSTCFLCSQCCQCIWIVDSFLWRLYQQWCLFCFVSMLLLPSFGFLCCFASILLLSSLVFLVVLFLCYSYHRLVFCVFLLRCCSCHRLFCVLFCFYVALTIACFFGLFCFYVTITIVWFVCVLPLPSFILCNCVQMLSLAPCPFVLFYFCTPFRIFKQCWLRYWAGIVM